MVIYYTSYLNTTSKFNEWMDGETNVMFHYQVNIGFFIMSIVIMRRHQKSQLNKTKVDNIK